VEQWDLLEQAEQVVHQVQVGRVDQVVQAEVRELPVKLAQAEPAAPEEVEPSTSELL
jgi:hypothetical protein